MGTAQGVNPLPKTTALQLLEIPWQDAPQRRHHVSPWDSASHLTANVGVCQKVQRQQGPGRGI